MNAPHIRLPSSTDNARLFLAIWPDAATRAALQAWQAAVEWPAGARLTAPSNLHLTLHFIGAVPRTRLATLALGLARPFTPFHLVLETFEVWHRGIAVLQPEGMPPALLGLQHALGDALSALGLQPEIRPYRPHVTLARHGGRANCRKGTPTPVEWHAQAGYVLAESAGGYRLLQRFGEKDMRPRV